MLLLQADDPVYLLALPRSWFRNTTQSRLPNRLLCTVQLLRGTVVLRLLGVATRPEEPTLDFSGRVQKNGAVDEGRGRLRWSEGTAESVEISALACKHIDLGLQVG